MDTRHYEVSNYLLAADLKDSPVVVTIQDVFEETVTGFGLTEQWLLMSFADVEKPLILEHQDDLNMIANSYGWETDDWKGKQIELYHPTPLPVDKWPSGLRFNEQLAMQMQMLDCIRVQMPVAAPAAAGD